MTLAELADKWDADAEELLRTSKAYRSQCNAGLKSGLVGRATALMACAIALRKVVADAE